MEAVVKFFKNNFTKNRLLMDLDTWNESFEDWLVRTGNGKVHGVTKKKPADVFAVEAKYLKPVAYASPITSPSILTRLVHKDNTVFFEGNRYTVPYGTYKPGLEVALEAENGVLKITDPFGDILYAEHPICSEKGKLIKSTNHRRDNTQTIDREFADLCNLFENDPEVVNFLTTIRKLKVRYVRDQYSLIKQVIKSKETNIVRQALTYCITNMLHSAVDLRDAAEYFTVVQNPVVKPSTLENVSTVIPFLKVKAEKRDLREYSKLAGGESQ